MSFTSMKDMIQRAGEESCTLWEIIRKEDMLERQVKKEESMEQMYSLFEAMKEADKSYNGNQRSLSGLSGGDGSKIQQAIQKGIMISGDFISKVMEGAIKMGESNACMKRIVAAPTAGSCGVLSSVLLAYDAFYHPTKEEITHALYMAAGIGDVISNRASISGAKGGCQAEIGSASAMAAGAIAVLRDGTATQICHSGAFALKGLLGLVCDPIGGLVEVPCVKRNVIGAVNAITSTDLAIAGVESKVPFDEVIDAMAEIGEAMPCAYKETSQGGLAMTETGKHYETMK
ncbi:MAG: L-serine ammonia-lyase, iron-sulfur-dependent, subunit alpha [Anaerostipes sp.]|nr:L-serine ammonia-lyase, iron-sulfur-dependent, subunit alpha [Anaerostipes sp.]